MRDIEGGYSVFDWCSKYVKNKTYISSCVLKVIIDRIANSKPDLKS